MTDNELTVEGIEGDEATIACRATGLPTPTYEFYKVSRSNTAAACERFLLIFRAIKASADKVRS